MHNSKYSMERIKVFDLPPDILRKIAETLPEEDLQTALDASPLMTGIVSKDIMRTRVRRRLGSLVQQHSIISDKKGSVSMPISRLFALLKLEKVSSLKPGSPSHFGGCIQRSYTFIHRLDSRSFCRTTSVTWTKRLFPKPLQNTKKVP